MASGILGQAALAATTNTTVYTVPATKTSVVNVSITNLGNTYTTIRLAIASTASPSASEWIEYDSIINDKGIIERTGIVMQAGEQVVAYSAAANVSVSVYGYEE